MSMKNPGGGNGQIDQQAPVPAAAAPAATTHPLDPADVAACLRVLAHVGDHPTLSDELANVGRAVARAYKRVGKDRRQRAARQNRHADRARIESTERCRLEPRPAELLAAGVPSLPHAEADAEFVELSEPRRCYVCKNE